VCAGGIAGLHWALTCMAIIAAKATFAKIPISHNLLKNER
jgi:hypothetical protein